MTDKRKKQVAARDIASGFLRFAALSIFICVGGVSPLFSFDMNLRDGNYLNERQKVRAPELKGGRGWLNTEKPLSISGLKGKVVLLDFWTYGCINCIHIIPDLKFLEAKYEKNLVVIGVHSAKFENEKENENIRRIILRYGIEHPVINDADYNIWDSYAIRAWPTQVLIDPAGYIIGRVSGEGHFNELDQAIGATVSEFRKKGQLDETPREFALERAKVGDLPLAFPGKVLADAKSNRLFISDSNHNRIVVTDLAGNLIDTIGSGNASQKDGNFQTAGFNGPQGLAIDGEILFVADTGNHLIRRIDLKEEKISTIAGTGVLSEFTGFGGVASKTALRSPWDVEKVGSHLYIAMAGSHQIWRLDLSRGYIEPYAGTRWESRKDGNIKTAHFAQPSGIVSDGKKLFVADSESNIIREINFELRTVSTLVGGDLFVFGDNDGVGDKVRLQHPLGVELYNSKVLIADTYNHKIKILDPQSRKTESFAGSGNEGQKDGKKASFYEPGGISVANDSLYVADTNNHAVRIVNLKTRRVSTVRIQGLKPPKSTEPRKVSPNTSVLRLKEQTVNSSDENKLIIDLKLPQGFHLNPDAPQRYEIRIDGTGVETESAKNKFKELPLVIPIRTKPDAKVRLAAKLNIFYCRTDNTGVCYIKTIVWDVPIKFVSDRRAIKNIKLDATVGK